MNLNFYQLKPRGVGLYSLLLSALIWTSSCSDDDKAQYPTSVQIYYSLSGKQAAFSGLVNGSDSYAWDFGDGKTSNERNPVHVYEDGGYYTVTLKIQDGNSTYADTAQLAVDLTPYVLLTGGATAENGKKWRMDSSHPQDAFAQADAEYTEVEPLSAGILGSALGIGEVYQDEFTFYFDGGYKHDVKADGASFAGLVNQYLTNGGTGIVSTGNGADDYGLCTAKYTPQDGATFTYNENKDLKVPSVYGPDGVMTYSEVNTITFSGTEFIGFLDYNREVIIEEITDTSMRLVIFVAASPDYYPVATHALVLTFQVVK